MSMKAAALKPRRRKMPGYVVAINVFFILLSLCYILPMLLVVSASFTSERVLTTGGFGLFPAEFTLDAYKMAFKNPTQLVNAYVVTIAQALLGTFLTTVLMGMSAYPLSRSNFRFKGPVTWYIFCTMLFSGGAIPTYIIYTKWYHLLNSFWVYILPGLSGGAWGILCFRAFFKSVPESLFESARLDGASELLCYFRIAIPLSTPIVATQAFMGLVGRWNSWTTSYVYIRDPKLYTLQYLLQRVLNEIEFIKSMTSSTAMGTATNIDMSSYKLPAESMKYALCVIAAGPMLVAFPFFQKYFAKGLVIGSVKG